MLLDLEELGEVVVVRKLEALQRDLRVRRCVENRTQKLQVCVCVVCVCVVRVCVVCVCVCVFSV